MLPPQKAHLTIPLSGQNVEITALLDRDDGIGEPPRGSNVRTKKLKRREFENYLLDKEILSKISSEFDEQKYNELVESIENDDVKSIRHKLLKNTCQIKWNKSSRIELAKQITPETEIYKELDSVIFHS